MKRILAAITALCLLLAGCGKGEEAAPEPEQASQPQYDLSVFEDRADGEAQAAAHGDLFQRQTGDVIEITEKLFIAQTNDIYINPDDYLGKTIRYEGIYKSELWQNEDESEKIHYVIRYGPGCCGFDDNAGFEVTWDGAYPEQDDWVAVSGTLTKLVFDEEYDYYYLQVELDSLEVLKERGQEYVYS